MFANTYNRTRHDTCVIDREEETNPDSKKAFPSSKHFIQNPVYGQLAVQDSTEMLSKDQHLVREMSIS